MQSLGNAVLQLEQAQSEGRLPGRDLQVILTQVERAEAKLLNATRGSALMAPTRRVLLLET